MDKIDHRIHYIIMLDTETANTIVESNGKLDMSSTLVYDIGWQVINKRGRVYERKSYLVREIFCEERDLMRSAYYRHKIPQYLEDVQNGSRLIVNFYDVRADLVDTMKRYGTNTVCAHNARFDYNSLNTTQRWLTKSKYRYLLPYGCEIWDTLKMARDVIIPTPTYRAWCEERGYMTKHAKPQPQATAEILYRYISGDETFKEAHTGLQDVEIETQILAYCFRKHKKMRKGLWER